MNLTKEQKKKLVQVLSSPYGHAELLCDGYRVTLAVERGKGLSYRVMTYVNGVWKGAWMNSKNEHPEQKFMRKSVRPICSPAEKTKHEKLFGKRVVKKDPYYTATFTMYCPDWSSGKAAIHHLCKVCESVEIAPEVAVVSEAGEVKS